MEATPEGLAVNLSGSILYVANRFGVALIQTGGGTMVNTIAVAGGTTSVVTNRDGTRLYALGTVMPCSGDCGNDVQVSIDEVLTLLNIDLGTTQAAACPHGIPIGAEVDVALIIQAVNNGLKGCG